MKHAFIAMIATLAASLPVKAAVSGFHDSAEQISVILSSEKVAEALKQAPIGFVSNNGNKDDGTVEWTVTTQECDLAVYLKPIPPKGLGKTTYEIAHIEHCS